MRTLATLFAGLAFASAVPTISNAAVLTFQDGVGGYTGTADIFINGAAANQNTSYNEFRILVNGTSNTSANPNGAAQGLLRFDNIFGAAVDQIPLGSTINSATLTLTKLSGSGTVGLYELGTVSFVEGGASGSTWNSLGAGIQISGGGSGFGETVAGLIESKDFSSGAGGDLTTRTYNVASSLAAWSAGTRPVRGWALVMSSSNPGASAVIGGDINSTVSRRPLLTINFTPPPVPEPTSALAIAASACTLAARRRRA
jgi:hypothetical protein